MQTTTNYGFNIVEGTDIVNPLTQLNPNFTALDADLKAVADAAIDAATCVKTGTLHAVTRTNTDANVFKFTATGDWNTGDTMTVDGVSVSVFATDGTAPAEKCFVINTEVIAAISGTRVTLYVNSTDASRVLFNDAGTLYTAANVQDALDAVSDAAGVKYAGTQSVANKLSSMETLTLIGQTSSFNSPISISGLPYKKYHVDIILNYGGNTICEGFELFPGVNLTNATISYITGAYANSQYNSYFQINGSRVAISMATVVYNGVTITSGATLYVYGYDE